MPIGQEARKQYGPNVVWWPWAEQPWNDFLVEGQPWPLREWPWAGWPQKDHLGQYNPSVVCDSYQVSYVTPGDWYKALVHHIQCDGRGCDQRASLVHGAGDPASLCIIWRCSCNCSHHVVAVIPKGIIKYKLLHCLSVGHTQQRGHAYRPL